MAYIVCGIATSHGPMLATPPDMWHLRANADRKNPAHWFKGESQDYDTLLQRRAPGFAARVTPDAMAENFARCQRALDTLAGHFAQCQPDLVLILGNDQREVFLEDLTPAFTVFTGDTIENIPLSEAAQACKRIRVFSCAQLMGETILRINRADSVSSMFAD